MIFKIWVKHSSPIGSYSKKMLIFGGNELTIVQSHHIRQGTVIGHVQICTKRWRFQPLIHSLIHGNSWPEGGSSAHHWFGSLKRWCTVSCTCFCFYAGTKPPAVVSLFSPPSCTAAAGSSSVVYWDAPPGRVCGPLHKSADEQPSLFPTFAARYPVKKQTNKQI